MIDLSTADLSTTDLSTTDLEAITHVQINGHWRFDVFSAGHLHFRTDRQIRGDVDVQACTGVHTRAVQVVIEHLLVHSEFIIGSKFVINRGADIRFHFYAIFQHEGVTRIHPKGAYHRAGAAALRHHAVRQFDRAFISLTMAVDININDVGVAGSLTNPDYVITPNAEGAVRGAGTAAIRALADHFKRKGKISLVSSVISQPSAIVKKKVGFRFIEEL
ncbi:beta-gamma-crystallin [Yersinia pseudotuberculosis]|nr:beta-gamma-crystallin [Yersinia pseudotuberculosis]